MFYNNFPEILCICMSILLRYSQYINLKIYIYCAQSENETKETYLNFTPYTLILIVLTSSSLLCLTSQTRAATIKAFVCVSCQKPVSTLLPVSSVIHIQHN